jgi:predicted N-acetyltransferase YhbS
MTLTLTLRPGRSEDAAACGTICYDAFRTISESHNFPPDFPSAEVATGLMSTLLSKPDVYSVVAEANGRVIGSNFLWDDTIAGVGPITIDPPLQNAAVGRRLMDDVMERSRRKAFAGVRLVQVAFHSRSLALYSKLGFVVRELLACMQGSAISETIPGYEVRPVTEKDVESCNALCRRVHGHERSLALLDGIRQGTATLVVRNGRITAYTSLLGFFGYAVAETNSDLQALIAAASAFAGPGILVPTRNADLFRWCLEKELRVIQPLTLMSVGLYNEPAGAFLPSILY